MLRSLILFLALLLAACGLLPERQEETKNWSASKFYTEAKEELNSGNYGAAIKLFESLEARYPYGRFSQQAQLEIAYAYYKDQEQASAIIAADRFIKLHPNHVNVDYAYYLKGLANFNDNWGILGIVMQNILKQDMSERDSKASRESFENFSELVVRFPDSKYAPDAIQRMAHLVNVVAMSEVYVARYYMKRKAYVAAVNRAQFALKEYPRTPAAEEILFIMMKAYEALEMTDLRDDAERVLRRNFPDSTYLTHPVEIGGRPWWKFW
ncbi:Beta-barrel assembly machine subunit BamD [Nitrosomonas cryotolerans]|uniref:Outer membrane protein assembly factor BamD n=1 Tax=Nitrosomonas cryotolerans ATCC 49181 TaxID=1131553 RepID=A0A1N6HDH8_9PROT|nr:outer membrane protein assembly factor BamD [Nitrosomonas cryotolerans]SFP73473.1 Beta-barrel assembly machine subunit BamD [Nitrosomonas cryotolerans]SIO17813.1 Beta-barrel assembly machine subunit BamD [Nitrosomonas cryotolerans ATCC 49181]